MNGIRHDDVPGNERSNSASPDAQNELAAKRSIDVGALAFLVVQPLRLKTPPSPSRCQTHTNPRPSISSRGRPQNSLGRTADRTQEDSRRREKIRKLNLAAPLCPAAAEHLSLLAQSRPRSWTSAGQFTAPRPTRTRHVNHDMNWVSLRIRYH
ncbi:hypothetical protein CMUS01_15534 [Colletotrichum musicola]|uniref:Uncharacterized protein n=1 Tax=Colletotrichum musicola TaxID=2175873 RepID=A0A8H6IW51_9PEZI|nr:hypothetical protein CMUS01_15534 [Colletotrichum musicola]